MQPFSIGGWSAKVPDPTDATLGQNWQTSPAAANDSELRKKGKSTKTNETTKASNAFLITTLS